MKKTYLSVIIKFYKNTVYDVLAKSSEDDSINFPVDLLPKS